jgi:pimeloyl-ACP methyl ester carboxylesterase
MLTQRSLRLNGRQLCLCDIGMQTDTAILLLHGLPGSRLLGDDVEKLALNHRVRIIAVDRPGYGDSDPLPLNYIREYGRGFAEFADLVALDQFHVVGFSAGAAYALAIAAENPARVISITLISSVTPPHLKRKTILGCWARKLFSAAPNLTSAILKYYLRHHEYNLKHDPDRFIQWLTPYLSSWDRNKLLDPAFSTERELFLRHITEGCRNGLAGVIADLRLLSQHWHIEFEKLDQPIIMWHGSDDAVSPLSELHGFSRLLPHHELNVIPHAGHFLLLERRYVEAVLNRIRLIRPTQDYS